MAKRIISIGLFCFAFYSYLYSQRNFDSVQIKATKTLQQVADSDPMKGYNAFDKWFFVQSIYNSLKK